MSVVRIHRVENKFLMMDKTCLYEPSLSWGAKGLHTYLMSLPAGWRVKVSDLKNRSTNGRDSVRGLIKELETYGYISKAWVRDETTGKYSYLEYIAHELRHNGKATEIPDTESTERLEWARSSWETSCY
jgi:hypothetical protein